jgi:kynurenine 3-monooxygenase
MALTSPTRSRDTSELCVVSGAGPVGCLVALLLSQKDSLSVLVLEKREDHRTGSPHGELRSINLALSERGRAALRAVGLEEEILKGAVPMRGRAVHLENGKLAFQHYDDVEGFKCIYSVSRRLLNDALLKELEKRKNVRIAFNKRVTSLERPKSGKGAWVVTSGTERIRARFVLGCDGSYSSVREAMSRIVRMDFHRTYIEMGYMELRIPRGENGSYKLTPVDALHIWPREAESHMMMIALPNVDGSFTATLFAPFETLLQLAESESIFSDFMKKHFSDCLPYLDSSHGGAHPLFTSTVSPWSVDGFALLLGDAAHSQVPFFGQGMNAGLEDAHLFARTLERFNFDWDQAVKKFEPQRRPCGDAITRLSLENYEEMHTHAGSLLFRVRRRFEGFLARVFKGKLVVPLYYAVAFTTEPYDDILRGKRRMEQVERALKWTGLGAIGLMVAFTAAIGRLTSKFYGLDKN